jgi:hypothetical protein
LVKGLGKIAISPDHSISNVFLVDSLDYNLLSVSQLCKMGYNCLFTDVGVTVFRRSDDSVAFKGVLEGQLYLVDFNRAELDTCLIAKTNMGCVGVSNPRGSLDRRVNYRRVPQPRWVGARWSVKEGGSRRETGVKRGNLRPSCLSRAQVGCACSRGLQASTREGASGLRERRPVLPRLANPL